MLSALVITSFSGSGLSLVMGKELKTGAVAQVVCGC
jgi:hypothetical protein